uniref:Uncharacterized protein n=1 Tax=Oryza punctata TaxID=4537 RepID=A0A0E0M376_ORYPU
MENIWANFVKDYMACKVIWLQEFMVFKDKSNVFNHTGINSELGKMICKYHSAGQLLAVGKPEHKEIIEAKLKIPCLYNDAVMEVMWGIKHLMNSLVPRENCKLSKEDLLQMSYGMKTILSRHGFDVTPDKVDESIIHYAYVLYDSELCETKHSEFLTSCGKQLEELSGIKCEGWSPMKLAIALRILIIPDNDYGLTYEDPELNFSQDELYKLKNDGDCYKGLQRLTCISIYKEKVWARGLMADAKKQLKLIMDGEMPEGSEATLKQEMPESSEAAMKREQV